MSKRNPSLFESDRMTMKQAIELTIESLQAWGSQHKHWVITYSGGKDSTATTTLVVHLIEQGLVPRPETLSVLYADTRMELPPLQMTAMQLLEALSARGVRTQVVMPPLDDRYFVYMFGRGVPTPRPGFRWCTGLLKIEPMEAALLDLRERTGEKLLMLTGKRLGESAARDQRYIVSCSKNGAECGQGWYEQATPGSVADVLSPLVHWRVCHVWDWLTFYAPGLDLPTSMVAEVYGGDEAEEINARTGCVGCPVASRDTALDVVLKLPHWAYLAPLKRLRPLYFELIKPQYRLQKDGSERRKDGTMVRNPMRLGPLTMDARRYGLNAILEMQEEINSSAAEQDRPAVSLINEEERERIQELMAANTWPNGWSGDEATGDVLRDKVMGEGIKQPLLLALEEA
jgi:DNA sulfur modification protein DndC